MTILLLESIHEDAYALLAGYERTVLAQSSDALDSILQTEPVTAILTRGRGRVTDALMARCPELRVVARCGVGLDNIDTPAARARNIAIVYAPGSTTSTVAEHTLMLMLAAARRLRPLAGAVHDGHWSIREGYSGTELRGKTLGILGLGAIGQSVGRLAEAFGMDVLAWSRSQRTDRYPLMPLATVLEQSDVVSIHVSLSAETRHLIGAVELARMKPGALLVNTARGAIIDQRALLAALAAGRPGFFAADVLDPEPPAEAEPLLQNERVLITPHSAALTDLTYRAMCVSTSINVLAVLRGDMPAPESLYQG